MTDDEKFLDALADVVWRYETYHQYGHDPKKAIKALSKRAPGYTPEFYRNMFEQDLNLLTVTVRAVEAAPKSPKPGQQYSQFEDVNADLVMKQLRAVFPDQADDYLRHHIGMVIYWYHLR